MTLYEYSTIFNFIPICDQSHSSRIIGSQDKNILSLLLHIANCPSRKDVAYACRPAKHENASFISTCRWLGINRRCKAAKGRSIGLCSSVMTPGSGIVCTDFTLWRLPPGPKRWAGLALLGWIASQTLFFLHFYLWPVHFYRYVVFSY